VARATSRPPPERSSARELFWPYRDWHRSRSGRASPDPGTLCCRTLTAGPAGQVPVGRRAEPSQMAAPPTSRHRIRMIDLCLHNTAVITGQLACRIAVRGGSRGAPVCGSGRFLWCRGSGFIAAAGRILMAIHKFGGLHGIDCKSSQHAGQSGRHLRLLVAGSRPWATRLVLLQGCSRRYLATEPGRSSAITGQAAQSGKVGRRPEARSGESGGTTDRSA
jgi:hypothetical protein